MHREWSMQTDESFNFISLAENGIEMSVQDVNVEWKEEWNLYAWVAIHKIDNETDQMQ